MTHQKKSTFVIFGRIYSILFSDSNEANCIRMYNIMFPSSWCFFFFPPVNMYRVYMHRVYMRDWTLFEYSHKIEWLAFLLFCSIYSVF